VYRRFNAPHRLQKGWLGAANIIANPGEGDVTIVSNSVVQTGSTSKAMIQFTRAESLYVSLRTNALSQPSSYDRTLQSADANKVFVHRFAGGSQFTKQTARLAVGGTYTDWVNGFGIVFKSLNTAADTAVVTVVLPPVLSSSPSSQSVPEGQSFVFSVGVVAGAAPSFSYQWRVNGADIAGATSSSYSRVAALSDSGSQFSCAVTSVGGTTVSGVATLTVGPANPPSITTQPADATVAVGATASFSVVATGALTYQWSRNGMPVSGNSATLSFTVTSADFDASTASFQVRVSNVAGSVDSRVATLSVVASVPAISSQPSSVAIAAGQSTVLTVAASGGGLQYQWSVSGGAAVSGATLPSLTVTPAATTSYRVRVSNTAGFVDSAVATVTIVTPPVITTQPGSTTVTAGATATFSIAASGVGVTYQWARGGANLAGQTSSVLNLATSTADIALSPIAIACRVSTIAGSVLSDAATLTVLQAPPSITTQPAPRSVAVRSTYTFSVVATGTALTYQWYRNGVLIAGATASSYSGVATDADHAQSASPQILFTVTVTNSRGSVTSSSARLTVTVSTPVVTISSTPAAVSGIVSVTAGSSVAFQAAATGGGLSYQWQVSTKSSGNSWSNISGATTASYTRSGSTLTRTMNGYRYRVVVRNTLGSATSSSIRLSVA
jgi:hypothetical protein